MKHVIEIWEDGDRECWSCDCGHGGSTPAGDFGVRAEKHVPDGDQVVYRHPAGGSTR